MKTKQSKPQRGFSMIDLILVVATIAGLILVVLPELTRPKARSARISCTNNLKQLNYGFRIWAGDNNDKFPMQVSVTNGGVMELAEQGSAYAIFLVMSNELNTPKVLFCPSEASPGRINATVFASGPPPYPKSSSILFPSTNSLSYFVGLDAEETEPQRILAGDDHVSIAGVKPKPGLFLLPTNAPVEWRNERHMKQGNVALADGSAQGFSISAFRTALAQSGIATNRLAMP